MTMYLLLRNNKQSGPYSLDEIKNMGLKAYDLVWLEGKSAAWRYPCEIEELKDFAPAVEEQPFDRFYKKPGGTPAVTTATASSSSNGNKDITSIAFQPAASPSSSGESSVTTGKRIIYVTLPAGRPLAVRETPVREVPREIPKETERLRVLVPETETTGSAIHAPGDYPPLAGWRERSSVEFAPRRRSHSKERLIRILSVGLCILALLVAGIFIGLSLNKEKLGLQKRVASRTTPPVSNQPVNAAVKPPAIPTSNSAIPANTQTKTGTTAGNTIATSLATDKGRQAADPTAISSTTARRTRKKPGKENIPFALMPPIQKDSAVAEIPVVTREAVHKTGTEPNSIDNDINESAKTALMRAVSVGANAYSVGTFGGINDLQLTVTNRSVHPLELVVVEVKYIQANKKVYKTENVNFRDIGAGAALMQEAPKSSRGIRVQYRIISISSKELGLSYSGL